MSIKETKRKELKEVEITEKIEYFCDLCKKEIETRDCFDRTSFRVKFSRGTVYPEGGSVETEHAYFCEDCADKVKSALVSIGVVFETEEYDY